MREDEAPEVQEQEAPGGGQPEGIYLSGPSDMSLMQRIVDESNPHAHIINLLSQMPGTEEQEEEKQPSPPLRESRTESEKS